MSRPRSIVFAGAIIAAAQGDLNESGFISRDVASRGIFCSRSSD
jgi:hypothetical protein